MAVCLARLFRLLFFRRVRRMPCCHALSGPATAPALPCVFCFFPPTCVLVVAFHPSGGSPPPAETSMTALLRLCFCTAILISALPPPPANAEKDAALRLGSFIDAVFEDKTRLHNKTALSAVSKSSAATRKNNAPAEKYDKNILAAPSVCTPEHSARRTNQLDVWAKLGRAADVRYKLFL
eukprot:GHVT01051449.1.p1 GENE.GHVT01051449.1~~GHVT01051449.1.p1  ORF type:complete len:180 (-),score=32.69 GHVT01051449.1:425-964(-)